MAFSVGTGRRGPQGEINVTPLIDIVLVLLIIFMVMTPVMLKELVAKVPQKQTENVPQPPGENPIVVELDKHDTLTLNGEDVAARGARRAGRGTPAARSPEGRVLQDRRRRQLRPRRADHGRLQGRRRPDARHRHQGLSAPSTAERGGHIPSTDGGSVNFVSRNPSRNVENDRIQRRSAIHSPLHR